MQFFEGFHYLWHPLVTRLHAILASGELGELQHVETRDGHAGTRRGDPRWSLGLAGGALMDLGCYSLHSMRLLAPFLGGEPTLVSAQVQVSARETRASTSGSRPSWCSRTGSRAVPAATWPATTTR